MSCGESSKKIRAHACCNITGGMNIGSGEGELVQAHDCGFNSSTRSPSRFWRAAQINARFPQVISAGGRCRGIRNERWIFVPRGVHPRTTGSGFACGAELKFEENVLAWSTDGQGVEVRTARGTYSAAHLVITAGPWANQALNGIVPLRVTRQVMAWIQPKTGVTPFLPDRFPVFLCEDARGGAHGYGFPAMMGRRAG